MNSKHTLSTTDARKNIFKITADVQKPGRYYILTEKGRAKAIVMSAEEFESWQETLEISRELPGLDKEIAVARREYQSGDYATLSDLLAKEGFVVADKAKKKYAQSRIAKKSPKRTKKTRTKK